MAIGFVPISSSMSHRSSVERAEWVCDLKSNRGSYNYFVFN
jgi:hypothetical protein